MDMSDGNLCVARLTPVGTVAPNATGLAFLLKASTGAAARAFVILGPLPDPATLGLAAYDFLIVDPATGATVVRHGMRLLPSAAFGEGIWVGTAMVTLTGGTLPCGPVMVFASDINGLLGPQVAGGVLSTC